eukprot:gene5499-5554_t
MELCPFTVRLSQIASGLCRAVAASVGRMDVALLVYVVGRIRRAENLLIALMERVQDGRQRGGWQRRSPEGVAVDRVAAREPRVFVRMPRRFGWLVGLVGHEAAGRGSQLAFLLNEPEMRALMIEVPQARRILAPVCRMLGVAVDWPVTARVRSRRKTASVDCAVTAEAALPGPVAVGGDGVRAVGSGEGWMVYRPSAKWPVGLLSSWVVGWGAANPGSGFRDSWVASCRRRVLRTTSQALPAMTVVWP